MNKTKHLSIIFIIFIMLLSLTSCNKSYNVRLMLDDNSVYKEFSTKKKQSVTLESPSKEGHTFIGWYNGDTLVESPATFNEDTTLTAKFSINKYKYSFVVDNEVVSNIEANYGSLIELPEDPTKVGSTFIGWFEGENKITSNTILKKDSTYTAVFNTNTYTYRFIVNGEVIKEVEALYGSTIEYPSDPSMEENIGYTYEFTGWDKSDTILSNNIDFNAIFKENIKQYTYTFLNYDGSIIKEVTEDYNSTIIYPSNPTKPSTNEFDYKFTKWDYTDTVLTKNITFTPQFSEVKRLYSVKFINYDDSLIIEQKVEYGKKPTAPSNPTRPSSNGKTYTFKGWDQEIIEVTGNMTYKAIYDEASFSLDGLKLSILGDSISTFYVEGSEMNSYYNGENQFYYPTYSSTIKTVDLTWWYKLLKNTNMTLGINNSWSGTCAEDYGDRSGYSDARINTIDENGKPDIVIIYLGTNDCASGIDTSVYGEAIIKMINKINNICDAQIFITTLGYSAYEGMKYSETTRLSYNAKLREIAKEYNCGIIPLDDYIVEDNYMIYLGDFLHYNAKGANLLSKIYEKSIKEYYGLEYNEDIEVEHQEVLPEGVLGKTTVTSNDNFWANYSNNVFLYEAATAEKALYSLRIEITFNTEANKYYVTKINKSGIAVTSYECTYVLVLSDSHEDCTQIQEALKNVTVGSIVEFDNSNGFPFEIIFKTGDGNTPDNPNQNQPDDSGNIVEGQLHIGSYNTGIWTLYESTIIAYSYDALAKGSTYQNFYIIKLTKNTTDNNYHISGLKNYGEAETFDACDYYILIYSEHKDKTYYENATIGQTVIIHGDITSGNANLEFK